MDDGCVMNITSQPLKLFWKRHSCWCVRANGFSRLRFVARAMMLLAVGAFCLQGLSLASGEAQAAAGYLPEASVQVEGTVHSHGARHVHAHDASAHSHVHDPAAPVDDDNHGLADGSAWTLSPPALTIMPAVADFCPPALSARVFARLTQSGDGTAPPGLIEPPSTPSIV
jgi:hypothetical protein